MVIYAKVEVVKDITEKKSTDSIPRCHKSIYIVAWVVVFSKQGKFENRLKFAVCLGNLDG